MQRIVRVQKYDGDPDSVIVELADGSVLLLSLASKRDDPLFSEIKELSLPRTDGDRIFWINGASLTFEQILDLLKDDATA